MKNAIKYLAIFVVAVLLGFFAHSYWSGIGNSQSQESHVMAYELQRLNKMVVAEQQFSEVYSHKSSEFIPGLQDYISFDKKVVLLVDAKVQASYDLSKMKTELDSVNKTIRIIEVPEMDLKVFPETKLYDLDQSRFNQFTKKELNAIQARAISSIKKKINQDSIQEVANKQLLDNLQDLYFLAKTYGWRIEDKTKRFESLSKQ